jgi:hypothetical protein
MASLSSVWPLGHWEQVSNCHGSTRGTQPNKNKANILLYRMAVAVLSGNEVKGTQVAGKVKTLIDK